MRKTKNRVPGGVHMQYLIYGRLAMTLVFCNKLAIIYYSY